MVSAMKQSANTNIAVNTPADIDPIGLSGKFLKTLRNITIPIAAPAMREAMTLVEELAFNLLSQMPAFKHAMAI